MSAHNKPRRITPGLPGNDDPFAKRLDEVERRLASIVQSSHDGIVSVDLDGIITTWNQAAERIFGYAAAEAVGRSVTILVPPDLLDTHSEILKRLRSGEPFSDYEAVRVTKTGTCIDVSLTLSPLTDAAGKVVGTSGIIRDITERKRLEEALRRRVEFDAFLFQLSKTFISLPEEQIEASVEQGLAEVGRFLQMDRVTLLELSRDRAQMTVSYSWHGPGVAAAAPVLTDQMQPWWLKQVLRGEDSLASRVDDLPAEAVAEREYLRQRGVASAASIPLRVGGEIAGAMTCITTHRHVSWTPALVNQLRAVGEILWNALKRRQAMQALLAARETARESEERFRRIANTAPVMIWMSDVDKQVIYVNEQWLDFTGWPPDVAPGHRWIELIHPDDVERCGDVYVKAFDQRQPFQVDHRLRRYDGEYRWIVTVGVPRYGTGRVFAGYVGTAVDVTERKLAEAALVESHAALQERTIELERRTVQLSQMASDLTLAEQRAREALAKTLHDGLQQLLTIAVMDLERHIMSEAQRGISAEDLRRAKNHLDEAATAARSLSVELSPPVLQTSGLPTALGWLADWAQSNYGLEVRVSADPRASSDRKDIRTLLFESVRELLFNVVKHAGVDRVAVNLALGPNNTLCITVTDEGRGFDPMELDERAKVGRVGWGLFSIRERLTMLDGRFDIESAPGHGTRFRLIAPRDIAHGPMATTPHAVLGPLPYALRILIADDQPALREAIRELFQVRPELQVVGEAANGLEAIAQAHVLRPDVILMDLSMPEMDGVEATRRIHAELPFVHILGFSMHQRTTDPHPIELAGAEAFFTKGVDTQRLINHLLVKYAAQSMKPTIEPS